jgi:hypothetical protein
MPATNPAISTHLVDREKKGMASATVRVCKGVVVHTAHAVTNAGLPVTQASSVHHALLSVVPVVLMLDAINFALSFANLVWKSNVIQEPTAPTNSLAVCRSLHIGSMFRALRSDTFLWLQMFFGLQRRVSRCKALPAACQRQYQDYAD